VVPHTERVAKAQRAIFTIGHSTHPIEKFVELVSHHEIAIIADVRSFPSSRKWPQFNQGPFEESLRRAGIGYRWIKQLGGRRHSKREGSLHTGWTHPAFRSYADYTETDDFAAGLAELEQLATDARLAYLCSEGVWWRCHRRIISDHLLVRGWQVQHIMPAGKLALHALTPFARIDSRRIVYDRSPLAEHAVRD